MSERDPMSAFSDRSIAFLSAWSNALSETADSTERELIALSFWLRETNLRAIAKRYPEERVGLGRVFHVPPSNVPTQFAYSWAVSLLAGNDNIIRISTHRRSPLTEKAIKCAECLLSSNAFADLRETNQFVHYGHDNELSRQWVQSSQGCLIWGGDSTVDYFRRHVPNLGSTTDAPGFRFLGFPERFSACLIDFNNLETQSLPGVVDNLLRDLVPFDQQACSSPKILLWLNRNRKPDSVFKEKLWEALGARLQEILNARGESLRARIEQSIFAQSVAILTEGRSRHRHYGPVLRIEVDSVSNQMLKWHPGQFSLLELDLDISRPIDQKLSVSLQTLGIWSPDVVQIQGLPILRQVRMGTALEFDVIWDGLDLIRMLSRELDSRQAKT